MNESERGGSPGDDTSARGEQVVHYEVSRSVATATLDSPSNRNALSSRLVTELSTHIRSATADDSVRALVLTHSGSTFCAGADLAESASEGGPAKGTARLVELLRLILEAPIPVVARVDGNVRAGGLGLLAACDIAVAGRGSSFAFTESRLGLAPAIISLTVLPLLDRRSASRYFLTGERFDVETAERIGLVTLAADDPVESTDLILDDLRLGSPQGLAESKRLITESVLADFNASAAELAARSARLFESDDAREGILSFMERRPPRWASTTK